MVFFKQCMSNFMSRYRFYITYLFDCNEFLCLGHLLYLNSNIYAHSKRCLQFYLFSMKLMQCYVRWKVFDTELTVISPETVCVETQLNNMKTTIMVMSFLKEQFILEGCYFI